MAKIPQDLRYTKDHEWIRMEGAMGVMGITDYAQHAMGDNAAFAAAAVSGAGHFQRVMRQDYAAEQRACLCLKRSSIDGHLCQTVSPDPVKFIQSLPAQQRKEIQPACCKTTLPIVKKCGTAARRNRLRCSGR